MREERSGIRFIVLLKEKAALSSGTRQDCLRDQEQSVQHDEVKATMLNAERESRWPSGHMAFAPRYSRYSRDTRIVD